MGGGAKIKKEKEVGGDAHLKGLPPAPNLAGNDPATDWQTDTHPKIMELIRPIRERFPHVPLKQILTKGGKTFDDLPSFMIGNRKACMRHILGRCASPGRRCMFLHVAGTQLDNQFVTDTCTVLQPGIATLMETPPGTGQF